MPRPLDAAAAVVRYERRPVHGLPPVRLVVREHWTLHMRCPRCERMRVGSFPAEARRRAHDGLRVRALAVYLLQQQLLPYARVRALVADLVGARVSLGTLARGVAQGAEALRPGEERIKEALSRTPVLHSDETGVRRAGKLAWAPVTCTARLTHDAIHAQAGQRGHRRHRHPAHLPRRECARWLETLPLLHELPPGALQWPPVTRELTVVEEECHQAWAQDLQALLLELKAAAQQARAQGDRRLGDAERRAFVARSDDLLATGLAANPPPERRPGQRGRVKQSPARHLLERWWMGEGRVLAFLDALSIPCDPNQAEQDRRMPEGPAKDRRVLARTQRLGGVRSHQRGPLDDAQARRRALDGTPDPVRRPATQHRLGLMA
jgi:hypothetical protein